MIAQRTSDIGRAAARAAALALLASLAACATAPPGRGPIAGSGAARAGGTMAPYQVGGVWYRPREQPDYDQVGVATWYGAQYHNRRTASGEVFNMDAPSAAHPTLPLPCIVEVTNLENGKRLRLRVNDRGPFAPGRILDVSREAAKELGFYERGAVKVRVRYVGPAPPLAGGRLEMASFTPPPAAPSPPPPPPRPEQSTSQGAVARIQAGAFADRARADRAAALFAGAGAGGAVVEPIDRQGGRLWRVMVVGAPGETVEALRSRVGQTLRRAPAA